MCLILVAWKSHPAYRLLLAANRDEYHGRPARPAYFWEDDPEVLAGRDLVHGGTWLGVSRRDRVAAVTNIREPSVKRHDSRSRGLLVSEYLRGDPGPREYLEKVLQVSKQYDPFNLLVGDGGSLYFLSTVDLRIRPLVPGIYGVSNGLLDCPWPKVMQGKSALAGLMAEDRADNEALFELLGSTTIYPDEALPDTGVGIDMERMLSAMFIRAGMYGTRCSTVVRVDNGGGVEFNERSFDDAGVQSAMVSLGF